MIPVAKPFLPPKEKFDSYLNEAWNRNWLTNNGPLINQLELRLKDYLKVPHFLITLNGTIALQLAFKALNLRGKFITTPFTYVATVSSGIWESLDPVFVDIDPHTFNIDSALIEEKIDQDVSCIVATHVFGNPCEVEKIQEVADRHNLTVIYDAAHTFGAKLDGDSLMSFGDISIVSLHATKLYHMVEGGGIATKDPDTLKKLAFARNFGHNGDTFEGVGINAKNSEFHAAMGLANLDYIENIIEHRRALSACYDQNLLNINLPIKTQKIHSQCEYNYAYYPVVFETEKDLLRVKSELEGSYIQPRRYFYPSLNNLPYLEYQRMPNAEYLAERILCLPLYHDLTLSEVDYISRVIIRTLRYNK